MDAPHIPGLREGKVRVHGTGLREPSLRRLLRADVRGIALYSYEQDELLFSTEGDLLSPSRMPGATIDPEDLALVMDYVARHPRGPRRPSDRPEPGPVVDLQQGNPAGIEAISEATPAERPPASEPPRALVPGLARPEASTSAEIAAALNVHGAESMHAVAIDERTLGFVPHPSPPPAIVAAEAPVVDRDVKPGNIAQPEAAPAPEGPMCSMCGERWAEVVCDYPVQPGTCGAQLCTGCAHKLGELDLCPTHATMTFPAVRPPRSEPPVKSADRARRRVEKRAAVSPPATPLRIPPEAPAARAAGSHANGPDRAAEVRRPAGASPSTDGSKDLPVYSPRIKLSEGQDIFHASFGIGKVDSVQETRALVIFGSGSRLLASAGAAR